MPPPAKLILNGDNPNNNYSLNYVSIFIDLSIITIFSKIVILSYIILMHNTFFNILILLFKILQMEQINPNCESSNNLI